MEGIPQPLTWSPLPVKWSYENNLLTILAGAKTDIFVDPQGEYNFVNAPRALFQPDDTFLLSGQVKVDFRTDYDAGVLLLYATDSAWAKFCFEFSPQKKPYVVSVVNNGISDDCNHVPVSGNVVFLRIAGLGNHVFAFHYSLDGKYWNLVRYFTLKTSKPIKTGFSSQSPTGTSCTAGFSRISYKPGKLNDIRNGQ